VVQGAQWLFADPAWPDLRTTRRHALVLCARLLANLGAASDCSWVGRAGDGAAAGWCLTMAGRPGSTPARLSATATAVLPPYNERAWPSIRVGEA
jgi:hypothetical protein